MNSIQPDELDERLRAHGLSLDDLVIEISSQHSVGLWWHPEWGETWETYSGRILIQHDEDPHMEPAIAGEFTCTFIDGDAAFDVGVNIFHIMDSFDADLSLLGGKLVDISKGYLKEVDDIIFEHYGVLYIGRLFIQPTFRGKGIGSAVVPVLCSILGRKAGIVGLVVGPEDDRGKPMEEDNPQYEAEVRRMKRFFKRLGFKDLGDNVMVAYECILIEVEAPDCRVLGKRQCR